MDVAGRQFALGGRIQPELFSYQRGEGVEVGVSRCAARIRRVDIDSHIGGSGVVDRHEVEHHPIAGWEPTSSVEAKVDRELGAFDQRLDECRIEAATAGYVQADPDHRYGLTEHGSESAKGKPTISARVGDGPHSAIGPLATQIVASGARLICFVHLLRCR
ncbi:hypothetical protein [Nocardia fluminea]|uniref:hypothetical protein n=1 Tax=Nocardia fluminea TaxID=134984 RepID=UPI003435460B